MMLADPTLAESLHVGAPHTCRIFAYWHTRGLLALGTYPSGLLPLYMPLV